MKRVEMVSIGQIALDIVGVSDQALLPGVSVRLRSVKYMLGGAAANFAISSKVLGGRETAVISKAGSDALSSAMIRRMEELGVETLVEVVDGPPHLVVSVVRPNGERILIGAMNGDLLLGFEDVEKRLGSLSEDCVRSVHMSYVEPSIVFRTLELLRRWGSNVVVTYKPGIYVNEFVLGDRSLTVDLVQSNLAEVRLQGFNGFKTLLLEHERGFSLYIDGEEVSRAALSPRDRTGSGDIFTGLLVSKFLDRRDWLTAFEETAEILREADSPWLLKERLLFGSDE